MPHPSLPPVRAAVPRRRAPWAAAVALSLLALAALPVASLPPPGPAFAAPAPVASGLRGAAADASAGPGLADPFAAAALLDAKGLEALPQVLPGLLHDGRAVAAAQEALRHQAEAEALSLSLAGQADLSDLLARAAAQAGIQPAPAPLRPDYVSFLEAAPALGATAGLQVSPQDLDAFADLDGLLAPPLKQPILDLMASMVAAAQLRQEAFAALTPEETRSLVAAVAALRSGPSPDGQAVPAAAPKVDLGKLVAGARIVADASEAVAHAIEANVALWPPAVPPPATPMGPYTGPPCPGPYFWPLVINTGVLALGNLAPNTFALDTILSIDPGPGGPPGDCYTNNAGGTNPTFPGYPQLDPLGGGGPYFPVAVAIDAGGDDIYHSPPAVPTPATGAFALQQDSFIQGGAAFGIALLLDVGGDDTLNSGMVLDGCPSGFPSDPVGFDYFFVQGAAAFGVGILADLEGQDRYNSDNALHQCDGFTAGSGDDVDYTVRYAQGAGYTGVGILLDAGTPDSDADDAYNSRNDLFADGMDLLPVGEGRAVYLVDHTQGAGAHFGVGLMVESNGDILYNSLNAVRATPNPFTLQDPGVPQSYAQYFAYCSQGIVGQCLPDCVKTHEHGPKAEPCLPPKCFNLDPLGVLCLPDAVVSAKTGPTSSNVLGVLVDGLGQDKYNCGNAIRAADPEGNAFFAPASSYRAEVVQGVAAGTAGLGPFLNALLGGGAVPATGVRFDLALGIHSDLEGDDCYNSFNTVLGWEATLDVLRAQGVGQGTLAGGVLTDRARDDVYNSFNDVQARKSTDIRIVFVQGNGVGLLTAGVHADVTSPQGQSSDFYNSNNVQSSGGPDNLRIDFSLGTAGGALSPLGPVFGGTLNLPTTLGAVLDLDSPFQDPLSPDSFNSGNVGGGADGYLQIYVSEGAVSNSATNVPPAYLGGAGVMVEVGSANDYNSYNFGYGTGGPFVPPFSQADVYLGAAPSLLDVGVFVDLSLEPYYATGMLPLLGPFLNGILAPATNPLLGPDDYDAFLLTVPSLDGCEGGGVAVAVDAWDGAPPFPAPLNFWGPAPTWSPPWPPGVPPFSVLLPLLPYCVDV